MEDHALDGPVKLTYLQRDSRRAKIIFPKLLSTASLAFTVLLKESKERFW